MREQERARKFGTCGMNSSLHRLYFLVSPSHRCDVLYLPTSTSTATNMSRFFVRYIIISARVQHIRRIRISFKFSTRFHFYLSKHRRSFIADIIWISVSFKLDCAWLAKIIFASIFARVINGYKILRADARPVTQSSPTVAFLRINRWPGKMRSKKTWITTSHVVKSAIYNQLHQDRYSEIHIASTGKMVEKLNVQRTSFIGSSVVVMTSWKIRRESNILSSEILDTNTRFVTYNKYVCD